MNLSDLGIILGDLSPWLIGLAYGGLALTALWFARSTVRLIAAWVHRARSTSAAVAGTRVFYAAALAGMLVSLNTSWSYFGEVLRVDDLVERGVMFFVLELAQVACGWGMRSSIREHGTPGPARLIAWFLCAVSAYMAWSLSGVWVGVARVVLGPILSLVMLHLALGIEIRSLKVNETAVWVRITHELRERSLALLGLSDEGRDARTIARQRALARAARIRMTGDNSPRSQRRFIRALARADVANDPEALKQFINSMKLASNATAVHSLRYPMPFEVPVTSGVIEVSGVTEVPGVTDTDTDTEVDPSKVPPRPVALAPRSGSAKIEIEAILKLIEKDGIDAVTLDVVKERFGMTHSTAARRLRAAKERLVS